MDVFEVLRHDHDRIRRFLERLSSTTERAAKTRGDVFEKLRHEMEVHSRLEELVFYPALNVGEGRRRTMKGIEEHGIMKRLLDELGSLPKGHESWTAKLSVLRETALKHFHEEEKGTFLFARNILDKAGSDELCRRIEQERTHLSEVGT